MIEIELKNGKGSILVRGKPKEIITEAANAVAVILSAVSRDVCGQNGGTDFDEFMEATLVMFIENLKEKIKMKSEAEDAENEEV